MNPGFFDRIRAFEQAERARGRALLPNSNSNSFLMDRGDGTLHLKPWSDPRSTPPVGNRGRQRPQFQGLSAEDRMAAKRAQRYPQTQRDAYQPSRISQIQKLAGTPPVPSGIPAGRPVDFLSSNPLQRLATNPLQSTANQYYAAQGFGGQLSQAVRPTGVPQPGPVGGPVTHSGAFPGVQSALGSLAGSAQPRANPPRFAVGPEAFQAMAARFRSNQPQPKPAVPSTPYVTSAASAGAAKTSRPPIYSPRVGGSSGSYRTQQGTTAPQTSYRV